MLAFQPIMVWPNRAESAVKFQPVQRMCSGMVRWVSVCQLCDTSQWIVQAV